MSLVKLELLSLPEHLSSLLIFSGICVTRSLVLYVCFVDRCLSLCTFAFGHCVVSSSSIYGFYLQTFHINKGASERCDLIQIQNERSRLYNDINRKISLVK